ncbi:MAG: hypothetical protein EBT07_07080 [Actinobacteria bacterium]|nr:hypothetical protein [Actinomycetota bacterium]
MSVLRTLLYNLIIISIVSFTLTYLFAIYLNLSWYQLLFVFAFILWINQRRLLNIAPLQQVMEIVKHTNSYTIYGIAIFTLANVYLNIGVSAWRFGWLSALGLSVSSATLCGLAMLVEQKMIRT